MDYHYVCGGQTYTVRLEQAGAGYLATLGEQTFCVQATAEPRQGELRLEVEGAAARVVRVASDGKQRWAELDGAVYVLEVAQPAAAAGPRGAQTSAHDTLEAQMPGLVRRVLVTAGQHVERGQVLLILEAMKMEIRVSAPHAGMVEQVAAQEGQPVERGQVLVELAPE